MYNFIEGWSPSKYWWQRRLIFWFWLNETETFDVIDRRSLTYDLQRMFATTLVSNGVHGSCCKILKRLCKETVKVECVGKNQRLMSKCCFITINCLPEQKLDPVWALHPIPKDNKSPTLYFFLTGNETCSAHAATGGACAMGSLVIWTHIHSACGFIMFHTGLAGASHSRFIITRSHQWLYIVVLFYWPVR